MTALAAGIELACACEESGYAAGQRDEAPNTTAVVYVVADETTVDAATAAAAQPEPQPCSAPPAFVMGAGVMPAPLLAATLDRATLREVHHPGEAPPEPRYVPSRKLADFVRCRDLTCRFPGCDRPATNCDIDHTVPYPDTYTTYPGSTHLFPKLCKPTSTLWPGEPHAAGATSTAG